jgi:hypothetical protein
MRCLNCSKTFSVVPSQVKRRKYCSKSCLGLARSKAGHKPPRPKAGVQSAKMKARFKADPTSNPFYGRTPSNYRGFGKGGYVKELGYKVRSSWERDYLVGLKKAGIKFTYEPWRFDLGTCTYCPDLVINGTNYFIEIKGLDNKEAKMKRRLFKRLYDVRLRVVRTRPTSARIARLARSCKEVMP